MPTGGTQEWNLPPPRQLVKQDERLEVNVLIWADLLSGFIGNGTFLREIALNLTGMLKKGAL
jgi:hypothetical protein